ncbi:MAG: hypothetical protein RRA63_01690 [Candidatus Calescibacterium sp.]|jgi:hypothetical protein|nr:hypothetical protein [Candidatus Calescibacterium sp.]
MKIVFRISTKLFFVFPLCLLLSFKDRENSGEETLNEYERYLISVISDIKNGKFIEAKEKFDELKKTNINKSAFPNLSKKYDVDKIIGLIEKELTLWMNKKEEKRKKYFSSGDKIKKIFIFPSSDGKSETYESFARYIQNEFDEYFIFFDSNIDYDLIDNSVIINFWQRNKIKLVSSNSIIIDFSSPNSQPEENTIYFLPHLSHFARTIILFIKEKTKCTPIILYREDGENIIKIFHDVAYAEGVSVSYDIKYSGIDVIPFIRKKFEVEAKKEGKKTEKEIIGFAAEKIQKSGCVIILDNSKNSAAIIPQIRFIGAKDIKFFGIMWHRIKDYLEKRYYNSTFYADIISYRADRQKIYIAELKKISEKILSQQSFSGITDDIEINSSSGKIILTPQGLILRNIKIYEVGEEVKPVFELEPEIFKDKM